MNMIDYKTLISKEEIVIVQIGSHDGIVGEEYGLQEILDNHSNFKLFLIEPIPQFFNNLTNVYGKYGEKITYCNFAITDINGKTRMVEQGGMSRIDHNGGSLEVNSLDWDTFLNLYNIKNIDLLLIDCEGYEFNILQQINYDKCRPKVIRYEYMHIGDKEGCDNFIRSKKYNINYCIHDHTYNKIAY